MHESEPRIVYEVLCFDLLFSGCVTGETDGAPSGSAAWICRSPGHSARMMVMPMHVTIRKAVFADAPEILKLLQSVASWLENEGPGKLWPASDFQLRDIQERISRLEVVVLHFDGQLAASMYIEPSDETFWPEALPGEALYLHKIVVDRRRAGQGFSQRLLDWAAEQARTRGCRFLRLDCAPREKLVQVYTRAGFQRVGEDQVLDGFLVARLQRRLDQSPDAG